MTEKLLNVSEVSEYLGVSQKEIKELVKKGKIPAYKIGGKYLRFKKEQIETIKASLDSRLKDRQSSSRLSPAALGDKPEEKRTDSSLVLPSGRLKQTSSSEDKIETKGKIREKTKAHIEENGYAFVDKIKDVLYFNDFYIVSIVIIIVILFVIFRA